MSVFFPELNENNKTCSKTYAFSREKSLEKLWSRMEDQSILHISWDHRCYQSDNKISLG
jgi:hypothetical protein